MLLQGYVVVGGYKMMYGNSVVCIDIDCVSSLMNFEINQMMIYVPMNVDGLLNFNGNRVRGKE